MPPHDTRPKVSVLNILVRDQSESQSKDEISELKVSCFCRKPLPGLFLEAAFHRNIDLENSLMIGDSWRDKLAAERANLNFLHTDEIDDSF